MVILGGYEQVLLGCCRHTSNTNSASSNSMSIST